MNLDDETILSAYLDDELDTSTRDGLTAKLAADSALARELAGLARARDAVASLSRPELPVSIASAVLARIESNQAVRSRRPLYWLATAASVAFAFALTLRSGLFDRRAADVGQSAPNVTQGNSPSTPQPVEPRPAAQLVANEQALPTEPSHPAVAVTDPTEGGSKVVLDMLDRPGMGRILIVTDVLDPTARDRVHALLKNTARKEADFGRLTIAQGIVIDPEFPNKADVFAVVMDERERQQLLGKIAHEFAGENHPRTRVLDEPVSEPRLGTQLAEIGDIAVDQGQSAAGLVDHPAEHAIHALEASPADRSDIAIELRSNGPEFVPANGPGDRREDGGPAPRRNPAPVARQGKPRDPSRLVPVLVWVTSNQPARYDD